MHRQQLIVVARNGRCPWYGGLRRVWRAGRHLTTDTYYNPEQCDALFRPFGFVRDGLRWGYAPAGVNTWVYRVLTAAGAVAALTPLHRYAGGMTIAYRLSR